MKQRNLQDFLKLYENSSYDERVRVSFVYSFLKNMIYLLIPITIYTLWIQTITSSITFAILPATIEILTLIIYVFLLRQIRKG